MSKKVKLVCKSIWFYSIADEELFFLWIKKINSSVEVDGSGDELYLYLDSVVISDDALREIVAMFYRYKIDMKQLQIFLNDSNKDWFYASPKGYWHRRVFGK